jgi:hypothetical protein
MKYKVGDTVRIQSKEWFDTQEKDWQGNIYRHEELFVPEMLRYAGKIARLVGVSLKDNFHININDGSDGAPEYSWGDWMFDPDYVPSREQLPAKEAAQAMLDGETLYDRDGCECFFGGRPGSFLIHVDGRTNSLIGFSELYRSPPKRERPMNRWEILGWTTSDKSKGWVVCYNGIKPMSESAWRSPQYFDYTADIGDYWKARLLPDLSGIDESTIQKFEVEK